MPYNISRFRGLWSAPRITSCYYLLQKSVLRQVSGKVLHKGTSLADEILSTELREKRENMLVTNRIDWEHLVAAVRFNTIHLHNEPVRNRQ